MTPWLKGNFYAQWLRHHREEILRQYPDHYIAIDPEQGVVVAERDGGDFSRKLQELIDEQGASGDRYLRTHTSTWQD